MLFRELLFLISTPNSMFGVEAYDHGGIQAIPRMAGVEPSDHQESSHEEGGVAHESLIASMLRKEQMRLDRHQLRLVQLANKAKRIQERVERREQKEADTAWTICVLRYELDKETSPDAGLIERKEKFAEFIRKNQKKEIKYGQMPGSE